MVPRAVAFPNGTVCIIERAQVQTFIPGCRPIVAVPNGQPDQVRAALEHGYGRDLEALTRDHDPMHAWLADKLGLPYSPALYSVATGVPNDPTLAAAEESAVLGLQRFTRLAGLDPFR